MRRYRPLPPWHVLRLDDMPGTGRHQTHGERGWDAMRRALTGLAVAVLAVLALAGPASAAPAQVTTFRFSGTFAHAFWHIRSATAITDSFVVASTSNQGSALGVEQTIQNLDANGSVTGITDTLANVTSGFSFTLRPPLASASVSAPGLPATTCTFDASFNLIGCTDTTIDATATWTGQGPITRGVSRFHFKSDGLIVTEHFRATGRAATATGTVAGLTLTAGDLEIGELGTTDQGMVAVCLGNSC